MDASNIELMSAEERQKRIKELLSRPSILIESDFEVESPPQFVEPLQLVHPPSSPTQPTNPQHTPSLSDNEAATPMLMAVSLEPSPELYVHPAI